MLIRIKQHPLQLCFTIKPRIPTNFHIFVSPSIITLGFDHAVMSHQNMLALEC